MDIGQARILIEDLYQSTIELKIYDDIEAIESFINKQAQTIEALKCCGNCEHYDIDNPKCEGCFDIEGLPNWEQEK